MMSRTLSQLAEAQAVMPWSTCMALVMFFGFFVGMLVWVSLRRNRTVYETVSRFPLQDDEVRS
jgi:cbb3-type cytochrome oxidase subunit 3